VPSEQLILTELGGHWQALKDKTQPDSDRRLYGAEVQNEGYTSVLTGTRVASGIFWVSKTETVVNVH